MRASSTFFAALAACSPLMGCSLVHSGSDYSGSAEALNENGMPADALGRVFVLFGERDQPPEITECFERRVSDVIYADVGPDGVIESWKHANPTPVTGAFRAALVGDSILAFGVGPDDGVKASLLSAPLTADGLGDWELSLAAAPATARPSYTALALGPGAGYFLGGTIDLSEQGGSCQEPVPTTSYVPFQANRKDLGAESPSADLKSPTAFNRAYVYGASLYVVGGYVPEEGPSPTVQMAPLGPAGAPGAFRDLPDLTDGLGGTLGVQHPSVCAGEGHFFVVGGDLGGERSDVVQHATMQADGSLAAWSAPSLLPGVHLNGDCFVLGGRLYVLGGEGATTHRDTVVMAEIGGDGTASSTWDTTSNAPLPYPRAFFTVAVVPNG